MKLTRLEKLYRQPLVRAENARKQLPLEHILQKPTVYFPDKSTPDFDCAEIGPGNGDFLIHMAKNNPAKKFVAIEIGWFHGLIAAITPSGR